jgi:NAD(P)H dehydrogenase (quinone)
MTMFAVMGVTGQVGRAVANTLIDHGREVRVIVRSESKARPWAARGADVVVAAIENLEGMAAALSGVKGAFVMLPPIFDPSPGFPEAKAVIAELKAALIKATPPKVVVLSTIGAAAARPNLLSQLGLMEAAFADLPMPIAFLRAAWFMENAAGDMPRHGRLASSPAACSLSTRPSPWWRLTMSAARQRNSYSSTGAAIA